MTICPQCEAPLLFDFATRKSSCKNGHVFSADKVEQARAQSSPFDMAADLDGKPLLLEPGAVRTMVNKMVDEGELVAIIVRAHGQVALQVFGPPSLELVELLEQTTRGFRRIVEQAQ